MPQSIRIRAFVLILALLSIGAPAFGQKSHWPCPKSAAEWNKKVLDALEESVAQEGASPLTPADRFDLTGVYDCREDLADEAGMKGATLEKKALSAAVDKLIGPFQDIMAISHAMEIKDRQGLWVKRLYSVDKTDYFDPKQSDFPEMFEMPAAITRSGVLDPQILDDQPEHAKEREHRAAEAGLNFISFVSPVVGRPAIVFYIPGDDFDQWLHYEWDPVNTAANIAIVQKRDRSHHALPVPKIYFNGYMIRPTTRRMGPFAVGKCAGCHRTGAMPLVPMSGRELVASVGGKQGLEAVSFFNAQVAKTATAIPFGVRMEKYGPAIGPVKLAAERTAIVKRVAGRLGIQVDEARAGAVASAMSCSACHNGRVAGAISYPILSPDSRPKKLAEAFILEKHMPPGANLSDDERKVLIASLQAEYYGGYGFSGETESGIFKQYILSNLVPDTQGRGPAKAPAAKAKKGKAKGKKPPK